jgi:hypothetical protein
MITFKQLRRPLTEGRDPKALWDQKYDLWDQLQQLGYRRWAPTATPPGCKGTADCMRDEFKFAVKEGLVTQDELDALDEWVRKNDSRYYSYWHAYND